MVIQLLLKTDVVDPTDDEVLKYMLLQPLHLTLVLYNLLATVTENGMYVIVGETLMGI